MTIWWSEWFAPTTCRQRLVDWSVVADAQSGTKCNSNPHALLPDFGPHPEGAGDYHPTSQMISILRIAQRQFCKLMNLNPFWFPAPWPIFLFSPVLFRRS